MKIAEKPALLISIVLIIIITISCSRPQNENLPVMKEIKENWQFRQCGTEHWLPAEFPGTFRTGIPGQPDSGKWLTAKVPGTVHSDLLSHGIIEDFFYRMNENDVQWIEEADWEYRTTFTLTRNILDKDVVELDFRGLDTYADVYLNGNLILQADNMFVGWKVSCRNYLREGENELRILFSSPVRKGMEKLQKLDYPIPATNEQAPAGKQTSVFTRKAPFHYGWDWGPRLVTSGIWRPVYLKAWNSARIEDVYLETLSVENNRAEISADIEFYSLIGENYMLSLYINGRPSGVKRNISLDEGTGRVRMDISVDNPRLWWTNGLGEPFLYDFSFRLEKEGVLIDRYDLDYGVRIVRLVQEPDEAGHTFYFEVNGIPVFMKGANIIPSETLTPRVTDEMYQNLVNNAVDAGMNMLRVWGGAIYEEDYFYELCDRHGLLVWQDFMFACALQPGDEEHLANIRKEAEYNVRRLRNYASLALWCGNNENLHGWHHWGWQDLYTPQQRDFMWRTYERIFHEILPGVVAELDPKNSYWSSSPSSVGNRLADRRSGDEHDWTVWFGQQPFANYANNVPRFVSEWGLQAFPEMHTIKSFSIPEDWDIHSEVMRHRQRGNMSWLKPGFDGNDMIKWYMEMYYRVPEDFADFTYVSQILQARWYKTAIETHRRAMPHCMGTLYWQLNDCWPTVSWSTVDYRNRWKASHYEVKKAFQEIIVTSAIEGDNINTYVVSDRLEPFDAEISIRLIDYSGNILWSDNKKFKVSANTSTLVHSVPEPSLPAGNRPGSIVLVADVHMNGVLVATNNLYFAAPKFLELPDAVVTMTRTRNADGYSVELSTDKLVRNLYLQTADADAVYSDNFFDLLPGRKKTVEIITTQPVDDDKDIWMVSLNDLIHNR